MSAIKDGDSFLFVNAKSRTVLDLQFGKRDNGARVSGHPLKMDTGDLLNQVWKVKFTEKDANNYQWCKLINQATNTILDLKDGKAVDGTPVQCWADQDSHNSQWLVAPVENRKIPVYVLYNRNASKDKNWYAIDMLGGSSRENADIVILHGYPTGSNENQVWMLIKVN
ncbi:MAG: hypothetical protein M1822_003404 [Bathelium mastoideum]|nr:MAG: hypothetical protein M1822_003404 [Bathelium mastoideum]